MARTVMVKRGGGGGERSRSKATDKAGAGDGVEGGVKMARWGGETRGLGLRKLAEMERHGGVEYAGTGRWG